MIPKALLNALPAPALYAKVKFASLGQQTDGEGEDRSASGRRRSGSRPSRPNAAPEALRPDVASGRRRLSLAWLATLPFFAYTILFLFLPAGSVLIGAFKGKTSGYTLDNIRLLFDHPYIDAYKTSIEISLVTARARRRRRALRSRTPRSARGRRGGSARALTTFSGVAANFGGIPLAFAFIATLGPLGIVTVVPAEPAALRPHRARLQPLLEDRRRARLHVLPAAADDPRDRAGDRRAAQGVARGVVEPRRDAAGSSGATSACRC